MGLLVNGVCVLDSASAVDKYFSSVAPNLLAGATSYEIAFLKVGAVWKIESYRWSAAGVKTVNYSVNATVPTLPACDDYTGLYDGITLGWLVVMVWALAWGVSVMRKGTE